MENSSIGSQVILGALLSMGALLTSQSVIAGPVHAYYADEHNTSSTTPTGNRILEIDVENMELVNTLDVPGLLGHHADNGFNSKIYGVPKGSGFVNVIELRKDQSGQTTMKLVKKIDLIHKPRSGDAYNKKFNVILMAASNRPMGSFIDVDTDEVVGTIGENVDCTLTDGSMLLSHPDANTIAGATKYHCANSDHGGNQISGHPYWLTPDYAAIVDRANRQISVYNVWKEGNILKSQLVNHLQTRTSIHQIVPRDRTNLPANEQADFYAIEEGKHADPSDYTGGIAHALLKLKLTTNGLQLVSRMNLQRTEYLPKAKADRILNACISIYRSTFRGALNGPSQSREDQYNRLFAREGITRSPDQDQYNDFPIDCFYPGIPGGHNADFAPNNKHLYVPMAGGAVAVVDVNRWKIANTIDIGIRSGVGHFCFSEKNNVALSSNHGWSDIFNASFTRSIRYINSERPIGYYWIRLPFTREGIATTYQSHSCYVDKNEDYYYNFFTDGGTFYKIDLAGVFNNPTNGSSALVVDSLYTGGIPIQGSYIDLDNIKLNTPSVQFAANNDSAESDGSKITIDVLANDTGNNLVLEEVDPASNGSVSIVNGKLEYQPNQGFSGTEEFWYGISSSNSNSWEWALVSIKVSSSTPPAPLNAAKDTVTAITATPVTIDVLANDTGTGLSIGWYDDPSNGSVSVNNNQLVYQSNPGFTGTEDFWYELVDSSGQTTWGNVIITVSNNASSLKANADTANVASGDSVAIDVLANDTGAGLSIGWYDDPDNGQVSVNNGQIIYTPNASFSGVEVFWYELVDRLGQTTWGKVTVTVQGGGGVRLNARNDTASVDPGNTVTIDVLDNDTGSNIQINDVDSVWIGSVTVENNKLLYQADNNYSGGTVDIWYSIIDSNDEVVWAKATVTIN